MRVEKFVLLVVLLAGEFTQRWNSPTTPKSLFPQLHHLGVYRHLLCILGECISFESLAEVCYSFSNVKSDFSSVEYFIKANTIQFNAKNVKVILDFIFTVE